MAYEILQFNLSTGKAQGFVLRGTGDHEGTNVSLSAHDVMAYATDGATLAGFLDREFSIRHGERIAAQTANEIPPHDGRKG